MKIVKKQMLRILAFVMALCLMVICFAGCGEETITNAYKSGMNEKVYNKELIASNSEYRLKWDAEARAVIYEHKSGSYWSDIFYEAFKDGSIGDNGSSALNITVVNTKTLEWDTVTSASVTEDGAIYTNEAGEMVDAGNIYCGEIENGLRVYYFFEQYKIAVPIDYILEENHIKIQIDSSLIMEDGEEYVLSSVGVAPNFCSVKNSADANIFVPAGNGAIINCSETTEGTLSYQAPIYGRDATIRNPISRQDDEAIRLPVFGAYNSKQGLLGIVEGAVGSTEINVEAANSRTGYSTVSPVFLVRGYDEFMYEYYGQNIFRTTKRVNDDISGQVFSVAYYPLYGADADYNGMAKKYRSYLEEKGELKKIETETSPYSVTFLGGTNTTQSFFGIPYKEISPLTTFSQAQEILKTLKKDNGILPEVRLMGYGDNGLRAGSIAGGSSYPSVYGSTSDLEDLMSFCKSTNLFLDNDIVFYSKSGNGFSVSGDMAKTAILYDAEVYPTSPTRVKDDANKYYALGRDYLIEAGDAAIEKAEDYDAKAISFSTLGSTAYSDYNDNKYINRNSIEADAKKIIEKAKKNGYLTAVAEANSYAACAADVVFDAPSTSGDYDVFTYDVPFYQMVFHSYKSLYTESVNIAQNPDKEIAKAVAYGMGLSYYITDGYEGKSDDLEEYKLYATVFEDNQQKIKTTMVDKGFINIYNSVKDATLDNYTIINGVARSVFSNGVVIYTNLLNEVANSSVGNLQPYEFKIG
ncbi:MAG: hypothetical protein E7542_00680 [Ruminococcaceae bacterium]|nr:hypothetical protein [Oscillospiraceae bacterium]